MRDTAKVSSVTTASHHCRGGPSQSDRQEEEIRCIETGKEEIELSFYRTFWTRQGCRDRKQISW